MMDAVEHYVSCAQASLRRMEQSTLRDEALAYLDKARDSPANDGSSDGWRPIVQRPTDQGEGWLRLADGSTFWGRWNRDHWERRTDTFTMTTPIPAPVGGVERTGVEYPLNVFESLPNHVYPVAWRNPVASPPHGQIRAAHAAYTATLIPEMDIGAEAETIKELGE